MIPKHWSLENIINLIDKVIRIISGTGNFIIKPTHIFSYIYFLWTQKIIQRTHDQTYIGILLYDHVWFDTILNDLVTDILMYNLMNIDIFIHDLILVEVLYMVYSITFIDTYFLKSVHALNNNDKYIVSVQKHKTELKYHFGTAWKIIWSNHSWPKNVVSQHTPAGKKYTYYFKFAISF